jgi:uncharacterized membrane protein
MSDEERREILYDYEEHFRMGMVDGRSEEQISKSLGNPRMVGKAYAIDALLDESKEGGGVGAASVVRAVFASISLGFFNIIFVLGPFLVIVGVMIGLWAAAAALGVSGLAVLLSPLAAVIVPGAISLSGMNPAFLFFAGVGVAALGVLAVIGMIKVSELFVRLIAAYVRLNARIVSRRK